METEKLWYVLFAPNGFGKYVVLYRLEKKLEEMGIELSYPCIEIDDAGKKSIKPVFGEYAFIKCNWEPKIEAIIRDILGKPIWILTKEKEVVVGNKKVSTRVPASITQEDMDRIYATTTHMEQDVDYCQEVLTSLKVNDEVRFVRGVLKDFCGRIVRMLSASSMVVEVKILGRLTETVVQSNYLEKV